jgi:hypothetical protein
MSYDARSLRADIEEAVDELGMSEVEQSAEAFVRRLTDDSRFAAAVRRALKRKRPGDESRESDDGGE